MMFRQEEDIPHSLRSFGRLLPEKPTYQTVRNWAKDGVWNRSRTKRVYLQTIKGPGGLRTTWKLYAQFHQEQQV